MSAAMPELVGQLVLDGTKVGWYPERIAAWERGERIAPITIDVAMTRACQYACHFCSAQLMASEPEAKITREVFFDFLTDAAEMGVKGVAFISDGESTVVPWYADAVEYAASLGLAVGAGSNGQRLTKPVLERILPHLTYLRFNFSGGEPKRYAEIMGVPQAWFWEVRQNILDGMEIIHRDGLSCALNMQLVCDPKDGDQLIPFANLSAELRPVYSIVKHCADSADGALGVDYSKYKELESTFDEVEAIGKRAGVRIDVKRDKMEGKRQYDRCYGPPFLLQISGNGLVAPCSALFNEKYKAFHIGSIATQRFRDIVASDRYWDVVRYLGSDQFDPRTRCGPNCVANNTNKFLYEYKAGRVSLPTTPAPPHLAFL